MRVQPTSMYTYKWVTLRFSCSLPSGTESLVVIWHRVNWTTYLLLDEKKMYNYFTFVSYNFFFFSFLLSMWTREWTVYVVTVLLLNGIFQSQCSMFFTLMSSIKTHLTPQQRQPSLESLSLCHVNPSKIHPPSPFLQKQSSCTSGENLAVYQTGYPCVYLCARKCVKPCQHHLLHMMAK